MTCAFGIPWDVCMRGCLWCAAECERLSEAFKAAVARGEFDEQGYTSNERKAQKRKAAEVRHVD